MNKKIRKVEEKFLEDTIDKEMYLKYKAKYTNEIQEIEQELAKTSKLSSNLKKVLNYVSEICSKPLSMWESGSIYTRTQHQNFIFPDGIFYNRENDGVRTSRINSFLSLIPNIVKKLEDKKKGETIKFDNFSFMVTLAGFKPATATAVMWYSIQLNYKANFYCLQI